MKNRKMFGIRITGIIIAAVILLLSTPLAAMAEKDYMPDSSVEEAAAVESDEITSIENTDDEGIDDTETGNSETGNEGIGNEETDDEEILNEEPVNEEGKTSADNDTDEEKAAILPDDEEVKEDTESPAGAESDDSETEEIKEEEISLTAEDIVGIWTIDGTTVYEFGEDGQGALVLPEHSYSFVYTIEADKLLLKFDNSSIGKVIFKIKPADDAIILEREEETGTAEFMLEKQESEEIVIE